MTQKVGGITVRIIKQLYGNGNVNKAALANFRGASDFSGPRAQAVWSIIVPNLDDQMLSISGEPTHEEAAIFTALRLYAIRQQGIDECVYGSSKAVAETADSGVRFFTYLAQVRQRSDHKDSLDLRVQRVISATNLSAVINGLTQLIRQSKASSKLAKIDYGRLAEDLYWYQTSLESGTRVRVRWGQDYYRASNQTEENEGEDNND